ncbi:MAG: hypothetical protein HY296_05070 [Thaumarchaeota archaeon]|nr:hypothetical protein [Nitrososphaerota archaeon]
MENVSRRHAVSTIVVVGILVAVIVVAAGGYYLLAPGNTGTTSQSTTPTSTHTTSSATTSNNLVDISLILNGTTSAGFYDNQVVSFLYTQDFTCTPALSNFAQNQTEANLAAARTACEVGGGNRTAVANAAPVFILVPAFAGLSIFGVQDLGATSQGYPTFNNHLVFTQCGAGGTKSACSDHPTLIYSPYFTAVEQHLGIKTGYGGLPEGVLPTPAHDHVVNYAGGPSIPWDVITVLVFDPNIMPDGATGECHQWVNSNLTSATGNCLTSFDALTAAMTTNSAANAAANSTQSNPIYTTLGGPSAQILIPGVTIVSDTSPTNTNLFLYFSVANSDPYNP